MMHFQLSHCISTFNCSLQISCIGLLAKTKRSLIQLTTGNESCKCEVSHKRQIRNIAYCTSVFRRVRKISKSDYYLHYVSVRPHKTTCHSLDRFSWDLMFEYFSKSVEKIQASLNEDQNTFLITSRRIIFRVRQIYRENQNTFHVPTSFLFRKSWHLWDNVEKYCAAGQATVDIMAQARCRLNTWGYKHT